MIHLMLAAMRDQLESSKLKECNTSMQLMIAVLEEGATKHDILLVEKIVSTAFFALRRDAAINKETFTLELLDIEEYCCIAFLVYWLSWDDWTK